MKLYFDGTISVKSILEQKKRPITMLYIDAKKKSKDFHYIASLAKKMGVPISIVKRDQLDLLCGHSRHGGIVLEACQRDYTNLDTISSFPFFYVNGVEDPYNLGSVCRTLFALGINDMVVLKRDWKSAESIIQKASAGAYEKINIVQIENDQMLVDYCQANQIPILCAHRHQAIKLTEYQWPEKVCMAVGGALRGLSATITSSSAQNIYIPYLNDFRNALDTPGAISILAYEMQRRKL